MVEPWPGKATGDFRHDLCVGWFDGLPPQGTAPESARIHMNRRFDQPIVVTLLALLVTGWFASAAQAQTLRLRQAGTNATRVGVQVGQVINIEVVADLQGVASAGISFFISVPDNAFLVSDQGQAGQVGNQPFRVPRPSLFSDGVVASNLLLPESDLVASTIPGQQLDFSAVIGLGSNRNVVGSGVVATFQLVAIQPIENGQIKIDDNPVRETKLVLSDGQNERRFVTTQGMEINVSGLELRDIPDVILQPGQSDSTAIGSLDRYLVNTRSPADSIRWSFEPATHDSVSITIDPDTRVVRVVPLPDWRGRLRLVWTATDPQPPSPGQPLLSTTEVTTIVVNNRPNFDIEPDSLGVKRLLVRLVEDRNKFVPGVNSPDERQAYRGQDLDDLVFDPDVGNPDLELAYSVQPLPPGRPLTEANVRGGTSNTHDLLLWSRPDFGGTDSLGQRAQGLDSVTVFGGRDSLRIFVQDLFGGRDTMIVTVEVEEVHDAPRILETETNPRIARGGTKVYSLPTFVEDPDTPLDDLIISWLDDEDGRFTVDTLRASTGELLLRVTGDPGFVGTGRVVFTVADPLDPEVLRDQQAFFFSSAEALPPDVFPDNIKVPTEPGGTWTNPLDDYVSDPDNADGDLRWSIPVGSLSTVGINANRELSVTAPDNFHGFEQIVLTVSDPGGQSDMLTLRVYSSDGRPVTGGIPDLILDRGAQHREFDLDEYYHDSNNTDDQMTWREQPTFDEQNLSVSIDPLTHIVTYAVSPNASFGTETVVFRVTDTDGVSAQDTMLVTIQTGGQGSDGAFQILPALPPLQAPVGTLTQVLPNLNDFIVTSPELSRSSITWALESDGDRGIVGVSRRPDATHPDGVRWVLSVLGEVSGTDSLVLVATDSLGRTEKALTTIRYFGESEQLELRAIPDIVFIAGTFFDGLRLNDFIVDQTTHADSLIRWSFLDVGTSGGDIIVEINDSSSVRALSFDIAETEVIFIAHNDSLGVTGRDTVRVIAQDPALAARELLAMPPLVVQAGSTDSSIVLNEFLPEDLEAAQTNWSVSGASITNPVIDPVSPHLLRLTSIGTTVGNDTLTFRVSLGGGFTATGQMVVTVIEPIDESTLAVRLVPNPVSANFVDFFVMARTELTSSPTVTVNFEGDTTIAVRQIEDELATRGVLIWAGSFKVRVGGSGALRLGASAITALGTSVSAQATISIATAGIGKPVALHDGAVRLDIPADVVRDGQLIYLQARPVAETRKTAAKPTDQPELVLQQEVLMWPADLRLGQPAQVTLRTPMKEASGLYRSRAGAWEWVAAGPVAEIDQLGRYAIMVDQRAPQVESLVDAGGVLHVLASDAGSDIDPDGVFALVNGERFNARPDGDGWTAAIELSEPPQAGLQSVLVVVRDRAGNETSQRLDMALAARLPRTMELGANYPNPFNPETTIPLQVPDAGGSNMRLRIYSVTGQVVRELLSQDSDGLNPGWHEVHWDGRDDGGRPVSSGVYFYRLESAGLLRTRSMTLLK